MILYKFTPILAAVFLHDLAIDDHSRSLVAEFNLFYYHLYRFSILLGNATEVLIMRKFVNEHVFDEFPLLLFLCMVWLSRALDVLRVLAGVDVHVHWHRVYQGLGFLI